MVDGKHQPLITAKFHEISEAVGFYGLVTSAFQPAGNAALHGRNNARGAGKEAGDCLTYVSPAASWHLFCCTLGYSSILPATCPPALLSSPTSHATLEGVQYLIHLRFLQ